MGSVVGEEVRHGETLKTLGKETDPPEQRSKSTGSPDDTLSGQEGEWILNDRNGSGVFVMFRKYEQPALMTHFRVSRTGRSTYSRLLPRY